MSSNKTVIVSVTLPRDFEITGENESELGSPPDDTTICTSCDPEVTVKTPTQVIEVRPHARSRSLGRSRGGDVWGLYSRRSTSARRGRSRVSALEEGGGSGTLSRDAANSRSSSRPLTPLNDGPAPMLPGRRCSSEPDATSVKSAPESSSCMVLPEPTAPGADSHVSLLQRYRPDDTLIGRIPEQPETRENLVTQLMHVGLFVIQPVYLSHRFQEYNGEKLMVLDEWGNPLLFAVETTRSALRRHCCCCCSGHKRPHQMMLYDMEERPVAFFSRRLACASCWSPCCLQRVRLKDVIRTQEEEGQTESSAAPVAASEIYYGQIRQRWRPLGAEFICSGIRGGVVLRVVGPGRGCCCAGSSRPVFHILSMHGKARIGKVGAEWKALDVSVFRRTDNYGVEFDRELPSRAKMTLLGAALLLDFLYYNIQSS